MIPVSSNCRKYTGIPVSMCKCSSSSSHLSSREKQVGNAKFTLWNPVKCMEMPWLVWGCVPVGMRKKVHKNIFWSPRDSFS